jgi:hypothetical protein
MKDFFESESAGITSLTSNNADAISSPATNNAGTNLPQVPDPSFVGPPVLLVKPPENVLHKYSLRGMSSELKKELAEQRFVLSGIALQGQATVIYGQPGAGKTALTLRLLQTAIERGDVNPENLYYLNCDDNAVGLAEKVEFAEMLGFHMLAPGYRDFRIQDFEKLLLELCSSGSASGCIIVVDTLKKATDVMSKQASTRFGMATRQFASMHGTVILLAHVNKNPGPDGKPIYAGTADILEDCDCAYVVHILSDENGSRAVEFQNKKSRGKVVERVGYKYSTSKDQSYLDLLESISPLDEAEADAFKAENDEFAPADTKLIHATTASIASGITSKTALIASVKARTDCSRRQAEKVIDLYTGSDPNQHHWTSSRGARGLMTYELLPAPGNVDPTELDDEEGDHDL